MKFRNDDLENDGILNVPDPIMVPQRQFLKTKRAEIFTRYSEKQYRAVYNKGEFFRSLTLRRMDIEAELLLKIVIFHTVFLALFPRRISRM